jgi:hypothetical protein
LLEAHNATLPPQYREFNHFIPAEWLYRNEEAGAQLAGFDVALERMGRLIEAINVLLQ